MAGTKQKPGKAGNVVNYLTRTQAVKRLQLRLAEFRRLCILKGVHPREPKKKFRGQNKTYYHVKDINFLLHEPLLEAFRSITAFERKVRKARARKNHELARQLAQRVPTYKLDHLVRERYPTFVDALRDIDDALCMVHLFATLPSSQRQQIPVQMVQTSRRLVLEWQAYCCRTSAIRKAFISVKGFYFQAEVQGQATSWLMPHATCQVLPVDVDFRVMLTFLEFYHTLLQFVFFKLYHDLSLRYPPVVSPEAEKAQAELASIIEELAGTNTTSSEARRIGGAAPQKSATIGENRRRQEPHVDAPAVSAAVATQPAGGRLQRAEGSDDDEAGANSGSEGLPDGDASDLDGLVVDSGSEGGASEGDRGADEGEQNEDQVLHVRSAPFEAGAQGALGIGQVSEGGAGTPAPPCSTQDVCATLFRGFVVWLSREVPREPLMLLVRAFGGEAAWDGPSSPYSGTDEAITHHVVDRPVQAHVHLGRIYVQPQWVFDCVNFRVVVPHGEYQPGKRPPPHLSPFLDYREEAYVPEYAQQLMKLQDAAAAARAADGSTEPQGLAEALSVEDDHGAGKGAKQSGAGSAADAEARFASELAEELGAPRDTKPATKRRFDDLTDEAMTDGQKMALMTRKQRKMFAGMRSKEARQAAKVAELVAKRKIADQKA